MRYTFLFVSFLVFASFFGFVAHGAVSSVIFSCTPKTDVPPTEGDQGFVLTKGKTPVFVCTVKAAEKGTSIPVSFLGKQTYGTDTPAASAANLVLTDEVTTTTLTFPPVYQSGQYVYTFSLINTATQVVMVKELIMTGIVKDTEQASIKSLNIKESQPLWRELITLNFSLSLADGQTLETDPLSFHIAFLDRSGGECAVLAESQAVTQAQGTSIFTLPGQGSCTGILSVVLKNKDQVVLDQKTLAVGVPEKSAAPVRTQILEKTSSTMSTIPTLRTGLIGVAVILTLFLGYLLIRRHRGY